MSHPLLFSSGNNSPKYLVQFKAGKMVMKDKMVTPIKRKGLIFLRQTPDMLMHFCWQDRTTGVTEDDFILFPEDVEFKKVPQCTTGRVYVLRFKSSSRRCFFWMQEPSDEKDDEYCKKINQYLNNPPLMTPRSSGNSNFLNNAIGISEIGGLPENDVQRLMNTLNSQQLVQMLEEMSRSGVAGGRTRHSGATSVTPTPTTSASSTSADATAVATSTSAATPLTASTAASASATTPATTTSSATTPPAAPIKISDLESIISGLTVPTEESLDKFNPQPLCESETLKSLFNNERFMSEVAQHLPPTESEGDTSPLTAQIESTIRSPQFRQALTKFSAALQSGQLGPLLQQFGFSQPCIEAANNGDIESFFKVLQDEERSKKEKKDEDEKMVID